MTAADLQLIDTGTGELVDRGFRTLDDIAAETRELFATLDRDEWQIGANLAEARAQLNGDREFGQWCSTNFVDQPQTTLYQYRRRFEVFGDRREEVAHIPRSAQYLLAAPDAEDYRELVVDALKDAENVSVQDVRQEMREARKRLKPPIPQTEGAYSVGKAESDWVRLPDDERGRAFCHDAAGCRRLSPFLLDHAQAFADGASSARRLGLPLRADDGLAQARWVPADRPAAIQL